MASTLAAFTLVAVGGAIALNQIHRHTPIATAEAAPLGNDEPPSLAGHTPEEYWGSFQYSSASDMLAALHVSLNPEDKVVAFPDPALGIGSRLEVYRAQPVVIHDGKSDTLVRTWTTSVKDLLAEQQIDIGQQDTITPDLSTVLPTDGKAFAITITRVAVTEITQTQSIAYTTQYQDDPDLEKGVTQVQQAGKNGVLTKTYKVRRENGVEVSRVLEKTVVTTPAITQITLRGTKIITYGAGKASWYAGVGSMTAAHLTLPKGTKVLVVNNDNGKSVIVTIADRGPYVGGRIIDLSKDAFAAIASLGSGVANVTLEKVE